MAPLDCGHLSKELFAVRFLVGLSQLLIKKMKVAFILPMLE